MFRTLRCDVVAFLHFRVRNLKFAAHLNIYHVCRSDRADNQYLFCKTSTALVEREAVGT